jgi:hypothetical protein
MNNNKFSLQKVVRPKPDWPDRPLRLCKVGLGSSSTMLHQANAIFIAIYREHLSL